MVKMKTVISAVLVVLLIAALASFSIACGKQETVEQQIQVSEEQLEETTATVQVTEAETTAEAELVVFNDSVLEERVRAAMNKPEGDITVAEAEAVKELDLANKDNKPDGSIMNISALASFKNLKNLTISLNNIKDLSPLVGMNLEVFYSMNGNQDITDFSPLAGSTAMLDLTILSNKNINDSNIGFIDGMTNIKMLWIQDASQLADISAVSNFSKLWRLILINCNVSDISPAAGLTNLKEVMLEGNPIKDYSPLKDIYPNLEKKDFELN
jgi:Leucine-rich repeat (LRR) protein